MRLFFNIVLGACTLHVVQGMNHCMSQIQLMVPSLARQFLTTCHFSYDEIFFLEDPRVSKWMSWIKMTSLAMLCDYVPSASMRIDSNSSLVPDLYIDLIIFLYISEKFRDREVTIFVTWALFQLTCRLFVLNNESNVFFFANVGSQAEAWRNNSTFDRVQHGAIAAWLTKVHPKVRTPLSNAKIAYSCATCNILAQ